MPIILATQGAEIRGIVIQSEHRKIGHLNLSKKKHPEFKPQHHNIYITYKYIAIR
jgi:hypothetical protein